MKKVLITGANSYIGTSFERYLSNWPEEYQVDTIDMRSDAWRNKCFNNYDSVLHVAGIAHKSTKKMTPDERAAYRRINAVLPVETAQKAKDEGVPQFVFLSSMSVYGEQGKIITPVVITKDTIPKPNDIYGMSKLDAEHGLMRLSDSSFRVCILRPPMVYGPGCKGNYAGLVKIVERTPVFPNFRNQRSMLQIDILCRYVKGLIDSGNAGIFYPQDAKYVCTSRMALDIARAKGKRLRLSKLLNPFIYILGALPGGVGQKTRKAFGSLMYDMSVSKQGSNGE